MQNSIELKTSAISEIDGKEYHLFSADFYDSEEKCGFYFYAISWEHAHLVQDIKDTAVLVGKIGGFVKA